MTRVHKQISLPTQAMREFYARAESANSDGIIQSTVKARRCNQNPEQFTYTKSSATLITNAVAGMPNRRPSYAPTQAKTQHHHLSLSNFYRPSEHSSSTHSVRPLTSINGRDSNLATMAKQFFPSQRQPIKPAGDKENVFVELKRQSMAPKTH